MWQTGALERRSEAQSFKKGALETRNAGSKVKSKNRPELFHSNHLIQNSDWLIICKAEDTFALQKGTDTYVQLHQHEKWAGNVRIRDLICSRRGLFAKVVILATQKIGLATAYANTWFNLGGCENAVSQSIQSFINFKRS